MMVYATQLTLVMFQTGGVTNCEAASPPLQQCSFSSVIVGLT